MKIIKISQDVPVEEHQYDIFDKDKKEKIKLHLKFGKETGLSLSEIATKENIERPTVRNFLNNWWSGGSGRHGGERAKRNPPSTLSLNQAFPHLGNGRDILDKNDILKHLKENSTEGLSLSEIATIEKENREKVRNILNNWWSGGRHGGERAKRNPPSTLSLNQAFPHLGNGRDILDKDKKDDLLKHLKENSTEGLSLSEIATKENIERPTVRNFLNNWWSGGSGGTGGERKRRDPPSTLSLNQAFPHLGNGRDILDKDKKDDLLKHLKENSTEGKSLDQIATKENIEREKVRNFLKKWWHGQDGKSGERKRRNLPSTLSLNQAFPHLSNKGKESIHTEGGESRSWHEVVIRDIFFFTGTNFIYEPWYNLDRTKEVAAEVNGKEYDDVFKGLKDAAEDFNREKDEEGNPIPLYSNGEPLFDDNGNQIYKKRTITNIDGKKQEYNAYEKVSPSPDFLINGKLYFEVFGWSGEDYELRKEFKKVQFTLLGDFNFIEKDPLDVAANDNRSLRSYAIALDKKCSFPLGLNIYTRLKDVAPLLGEKGIKLVDNYVAYMENLTQEVDGKSEATTELTQNREFFNKNISGYWDWYTKSQEQKYEQWKQKFIDNNDREPNNEDLNATFPQEFEPTEEARNNYLSQQASALNWYKVSISLPQGEEIPAQGEGIPKRPLTIQQIGQELVSQGYWTANLWSAEDKVAAYYRTPEVLKGILRGLGVEVEEDGNFSDYREPSPQASPWQSRQQPIIKSPQQEQQVAAFNLSRMKK